MALAEILLTHRGPKKKKKNRKKTNKKQVTKFKYFFFHSSYIILRFKGLDDVAHYQSKLFPNLNIFIFAICVLNMETDLYKY